MSKVPLLKASTAFTGDVSSYGVYPKQSTDSRLVNGSLVLVNPNDAQVPWPAGVPASGAKLPNLAWPQLATLLGSGDATSLAVTFDNLLTGSGEAFAERTTKGGLHICVSQSSANKSGHYARLKLPTAVLQYILANPTHDYYVSLRGRGTRLSNQATYHEQLSGIWNFSTADNSNFYYFMEYNNDTTGVFPGDSNGYSRRKATPANPLGSLTSVPYLVNARTAWLGTAANNLTEGATNSLQHALMLWGSFGVFASRFVTHARSDVFYGFYMEDLTVSGRSYATVDAADLAIYNTEIASGGALYNDSFTAVSTLP